LGWKIESREDKRSFPQQEEILSPEDQERASVKKELNYFGKQKIMKLLR
jgi:hypothetical protein